MYFSMYKIKLFIECIKNDWDMLKDSIEIELMRRQANIARWYTKYFTLIMYIITVLFVITHYLPLILDAVTPLVEPRLRKLVVVLDMFIDQQKYFHVLLLNITVTGFLGMTTVLAAETMLMVLIQHVCGLLKVTSHRITHAFNNDCLPVLKKDRKCNVCIRLARAVKIHKNAIMSENV
ncbi:PREDICTED: uncharacterized protein LOC106748293 [Dinoponera quadriceps]|uniref:Uncharacterized protein LOC106748293 n=1 Tax=Dinoponera quadriceps TaxID=609295 RepID=A0A6P3XUH2_DINQU|nr:PREDICTED: uncharacterized protein LOC106748293 [Dinoponera quadriceps]